MAVNKLKDLWRKLTRPRGAVTFFIIQVTDQAVKVVKAASAYGLKKDFIALEAEPLPLGADDKIIVEKLAAGLKKLGYKGEAVLVSLSRSQATCRFVKIPAASPAEIEKIAALQASKYLPYAASELISGYQIVSIDKNGYANVNLVVVQRSAIERYLNIFAAAGISEEQIALSSFGLSALYGHMAAREPQATILADIDDNQVELAVVQQGKMLFSRSFKFTQTDERGKQLSDEINRTSAAYLKETQGRQPEQAVILSTRPEAAQLAESVQRETGLAAKAVNYCHKFSCSRSFNESSSLTAYSMASLIGLGLEEIEDSLDLLPPEMKEKTRSYSRKKKQARNLALVLTALVIWGLGIAKNMDNKAVYLSKLEEEISRVSLEAKPFEEVEKRAQLLESRLKKTPSAFGILRELYRLIPEQVALNNFAYEEDKIVSLRGSTPELSAVFSIVRELENSSVFKDFSVKVKYATKKSTALGETVDFQIDCLKGAK